MSAVPTTRSFSNRRSAVDLLRRLGVKPYQYDTLIRPAGGKFQVFLLDGKPIDAVRLMGATVEVAEALVAAEVERAASAPRLPSVAAKQAQQVRALERRYAVLEAKAAKANAPKPRKPAKPKVKRKPAPRPPKLKVKKPPAMPPPGAVEAVRATSIGGACLELFQQGLTSGQVWPIVRVRFKLGEDRRTYPSWYLSHYRRTGQLPKAPAKERRA